MWGSKGRQRPGGSVGRMDLPLRVMYIVVDSCMTVVRNFLGSTTEAESEGRRGPVPVRMEDVDRLSFGRL